MKQPAISHKQLIFLESAWLGQDELFIEDVHLSQTTVASEQSIISLHYWHAVKEEGEGVYKTP